MEKSHFYFIKDFPVPVVPDRVPSGAIIRRLNPGRSRQWPCLGEPVCVWDVRVPGFPRRRSRQGEPGPFAPSTGHKDVPGHFGRAPGISHARTEPHVALLQPWHLRARWSALPGPAVKTLRPVPRPGWSGASQMPVWHCTPPRAARRLGLLLAGVLTCWRLAGGSGWGHCFTCIFLLTNHIPVLHIRKLRPSRAT